MDLVWPGPGGSNSPLRAARPERAGLNGIGDVLRVVRKKNFSDLKTRLNGVLS